MTRSDLRDLPRYDDPIARAIRSQLRAAERRRCDEAISLQFPAESDPAPFPYFGDPVGFPPLDDLVNALAGYVARGHDPVKHLRDVAAEWKQRADNGPHPLGERVRFQGGSEVLTRTANELARRIDVA